MVARDWEQGLDIFSVFFGMQAPYKHAEVRVINEYSHWHIKSCLINRAAHRLKIKQNRLLHLASVSGNLKRGKPMFAHKRCMGMQVIPA